MILLVAAEGPTLDAPISKRFGHAANHIVVDSDGPTILEAIEHEHDLPGHGVERFSKWKLDGVISGNVGPGAFEDLDSRNLAVYIVRGATVQEGVAMVVGGDVSATDSPTMKHSIHQHGQDGGHHSGKHHHH